ncbi:hypothetical protein KEM56_002782 [Ascosphaera pollenicola]|nr:hypothetical protein KEM56_002782 [Ascosphaera pollenicola]
MDITKLISPQNADEEPSPSTHRHGQSTPAVDALNKTPPVADSDPMCPSSPPVKTSPLTPEQRLEIEQLNETIRQNEFDFGSRLKLIDLLHNAFTQHVFPPTSPGSLGEPRAFEYLDLLLEARRELDQLFAVNERFWEEWIQEKSLLARTIEERINVLELCRRSVDQEYGSPKLWCIYGDWILYLYETVHSGRTGNAQDHWTQEDLKNGREICLWDTVISVWAGAAEATRYRINDSHIVWDKYLDLLNKNLQMSPSPEKIETLRSIYISRLETPHQTWDITWQQFSSFISTYYNASYEHIMVDVKAKSAVARAQWDTREFQELSLKRAVDSGDPTTEYDLLIEYINWELAQDRRHHHTSFELICAIYERALLRFPRDVNFWNDYILFIIEEKMAEESRAESRRSQAHRRPQHTPKSMAPTLDRATRHCPWSGTLWSQYILSAERECNNFSFISYIKHRATGTGILEAAGIVELAKVWTTYCSYLHRRAFEADSTDEHHGVAEVGIRSALEDLRAIYEKDKANVAANEALLRLERMYIQYLSDTGSYDTARERFKMLASSQGHKYEFWMSYYFWELQCWAKFSPSDGTSTQRRTDPPGYATAVLKLALNHAGRDLDWPQRIISVYLAHCEDYESADEMQTAIIVVKKALRELDKRRHSRRATMHTPNEATRTHDPQSAMSPFEHSKLEEGTDNYAFSKRKRESEDDMAVYSAKRARATPDVDWPQMVPQLPPKRDRENASVIARGLPPDVTTNRVKQFFRDCGRIKSLKMLPQSTSTDDLDGPTCAAVLEFEMYEDALSALTRDQKSLNGYVISVQPYVGTTLYVTNFPPEKGDEKGMRELFSPYGDVVEVRFPSLRYNPHRRFCYVQYGSADAAHQAAAQTHEMKMTSLDGKTLKLYVQISDPNRKNERSDASREGREIHVSNLIYTAEETDLRRIFETCGTIESVRVPKKVDGSGKGFAFILFETPEAAQAALSLEDTDYRGRKLHIRISTQGGPKTSTTTILNTKDEAHSAGSSRAAVPPAARTIALMNVPDTVNDARIRTLAEKYGPLVKLSLRPDHAGAILEFVHENDAGRSSLGLEGTSLDGHTIHVGSVKDLLSQNPDVREEPDTSAAARKNARGRKGGTQEEPKKIGLPLPSMPIRRPQRPGGGTGRRGGLGVKRFSQAVGLAQAASASGEEQPPKRNNSDFKMMLEQSRSSQQKEKE